MGPAQKHATHPTLYDTKYIIKSITYIISLLHNRNKRALTLKTLSKEIEASLASLAFANKIVIINICPQPIPPYLLAV